MASYHFQIATDALGSGAWAFAVNPLYNEGLFPERAQNDLKILSGSPMQQHPRYDTRIRRIKFDTIPGTNTTHRDFLMGTSESDTTSLLYLKNLDADGQLTIYWLYIPEEYLRPYGYRATTWIPIRVLDVITKTPGLSGTPRWDAELVFRIVPWFETDLDFTLGTSELGSENPLVTAALDAVYTYDTNLASYTDRTAVAYSGGTPFPSFVVAPTDIIYFGCVTPFWGIYEEMDTLETVVPDANQGATPNAWTYNGLIWAAFSVVDNTESFTKSVRTVTWSLASNWTAEDLSTRVAGAPSTEDMYWARVIIGTVTTPWAFDKVWRD